MGFYAERGVKTTNPDVKDMYAGALSDVAELASFSARIGQADAAGMQSTIDNTAALITARERLSAHLQSGQATEDYYVGQINAFNPRKVPLVWATLTALELVGKATEPFEVPLTALSAPGVINAPLPGAKQFGAAALVLSKAPRALIGLGRAGSVGVQAERMVVPLMFAPGRATVANRGRTIAHDVDQSLTGTNTLGYTTPSGQIFLRPGLTPAEAASTLRHESLHAFLSVPNSAPLAAARQNLGMWGYNNSHLLRFTEEALAEGYATRSLMLGIRHPIINGYGISLPRLVGETAVVGGVVGGGIYLGAQVGSVP